MPDVSATPQEQAGEQNANPNANTAGQNNQSSTGDNTPKTYSQEEFDKALQVEADKRVNQALETAKVKWGEEKEKELADAKTEAEKMAAMSAEEKEKHKREKDAEELAKREAEITKRELRAQSLETLAEKGLPKQLADTLNFADAESCKSSLEAVEKAFSEALETAVNERLKGKTPKSVGDGEQSTNIIDEKLKGFIERKK